MNFILLLLMSIVSCECYILSIGSNRTSNLSFITVASTNNNNNNKNEKRDENTKSFPIWRQNQLNRHKQLLFSEFIRLLAHKTVASLARLLFSLSRWNVAEQPVLMALVAVLLAR